MVKRTILAGLALWCVGVAAGPATVPSGPSALLPPDWRASAVYYDSFECDAGPDVRRDGLRVEFRSPPAAGGVRGRRGAGPMTNPYRLRGAVLSPSGPLTVSFWWTLRSDPTSINDGFPLLSLASTKAGGCSLFARGGPWCGLKQTAGCAQIWGVPGIPNINDIYEPHLASRLELKAGVWHHSAVVFSGSSLMEIYTDGRKVSEARVTGRSFTPADAFEILELGGEGVDLDEIVILNRPATADQVAAYVDATRQMREVAYPVPGCGAERDK